MMTLCTSFYFFDVTVLLLLQVTDDSVGCIPWYNLDGDKRELVLNGCGIIFWHYLRVVEHIKLLGGVTASIEDDSFLSSRMVG
jgi:hypothetical protein